MWLIGLILVVTLPFRNFVEGNPIQESNRNHENVINSNGKTENDVRKLQEAGEFVDKTATNLGADDHSVGKRSTLSSILNDYPQVLYEGKPSKVSVNALNFNKVQESSPC